MYNKKLIESLRNLLKTDDRLVSEDILLRNKIIELTLKLDEKLIELLLSDEKFKSYFFAEVKGIHIFDKEKFIQLISNKEFLPDSFTSFKNKIGLFIKDDYLNLNNDVVLVWPYKDCVLKAGMTKEGDPKRDEIFLNEILALDEIDRLFKPKIFTNFKKYNKNGEDKVKSIKDSDNLIIRGNNLIALHSLKGKFRGKVKLIYLDPPYNLGGDSFKYNDRFNHSTWLTFMKNRLETAKEFLREDGYIFIQINDIEVAYLKVLCDEIFTRDNFIQFIEIKSNEGAAYQYQNPNLAKMCEYGLVYIKNSKFKKNYNPVYVRGDWDTNYNKIILNPEEEDFPKWKVGNVRDEIKKIYGKDYTNEQIKEYIIKNAEIIFRGIAPKGAGAGISAAMRESRGNKWSVYQREELDDVYCYNGEMVRFYDKNIGEVEGDITIRREVGSLWTDIPWTGIAKEGGVKLKGGKKPEKLLHRIIEIYSNPGDLVMDFFNGTGTTCGVAHKMRRQYIGIEQLDYGENDSVVRLYNAIKGDSSPISRLLKWKGGGEFIYCELMKYNQIYLERIMDAKDTDSLLEIWKEMAEKSFLAYQFDQKSFEVNLALFKKLELEKQREILKDILDKNQLYIDYSEIDNKDFVVNEIDKKLNKELYEVDVS